MFSVIIPNYNRENSVIKAIESVLNQSYNNFELIIVDDCSTDNSFKVVNAIEDSRIKLFKLEKNSGAAAARNYGIRNSTGKYISFLDSDDQFEPNFLLESLNTLIETTKDVGFMWTGIRLKYPLIDKAIEQNWNPIKRGSTYLTFLHDLKIGTGAGITLKKEVIEKCGNFDQTLPAAEDTEFFLRISQKYNYASSDKILINIYRDDKDRLSKNLKKVAIAYNHFLPKHFSEINKHNDLKRKYYHKMMWLNYHLGDITAARNFFKKIPNNKNRFSIKAIKILYELLPIKYAYFIHKKLSEL